jgi:hypothetical protein
MTAHAMRSLVLLPRRLPRRLPRLLPRLLPRRLPRRLPWRLPRRLPRLLPRLLPWLLPRLLLGAAACGTGPDVSPRLIRPLPELVMPRAPSGPIAVRELLLAPQEQRIWDVHWRGLTIGRIELAVDGDLVHSRFRTGAIVGTVTSIEHELATVLDRDRAAAASQRETLAVDGRTRTIDAAFDDAGYRIEGQPPRAMADGRVHTVHSALGALRAWARPGAPPGYLTVLLAGGPIRLEVGEPVPEALADRAALRIDARALGGPVPATVTIWLGAGEDRAPLRIELATDEARVTAELLDE